MCIGPKQIFHFMTVVHRANAIFAARSMRSRSISIWNSEAVKTIYTANGKLGSQIAPLLLTYKFQPCMMFKLTQELRYRSLVAPVQMQAAYSTRTTRADKGSERVVRDPPDFAVLGQKVIEAAKKVDIMAGTVPLANVVTLLKDLQALGFNLEEITQTLTQKIWLLRNPEETISVCQLLQAHGFQNEAILQVIEHLPLYDRGVSAQQILQVISSSLENLRSLRFSEKELQSFLASEPGLLFTDVKTVTQVLNKLKSYFTAADALQVVKKCPNVLVDPFSETQKKFDYCHFTMGYHQPQIVNSRLFRHSLEHIKDRHLFLSRAGFFVNVKLKDDPKLNPNPPLRDVVDLSVNVFVKKFGQMNAEDYETFLHMREFERELEDSDIDENYDESESDREEQQEKRKGKGKSRKAKR